MKKSSNINVLFEAFSNIKTEAEAKQFCEDLCTPAELHAMADRLNVIGHIKEGTPYRKIHDETGVSVTTVGRVARSLTYGTGGYDMVWKRLKK